MKVTPLATANSVAPGNGFRPSSLRGLALERQTLPDLLRLGAERFGGRTLLRFESTERSFTQMRDEVAATAGTLTVAGIVRGDRVALMCENRIELLDLTLGCAWLGAVAVPLNTALRGEQLRHQLANSGARLLAIDSALIEVLEVVEAPPTLAEVWALDGVPADPPSSYRVVEPPPKAAAVDAAIVRPGDTAAILYTSGTTGPAKGVQCPHGQFYWWGVLMGEVFELDEEDVLYTCLPLFHTNALNAFVQALVAGATFHLGPRFWLHDSGPASPRPGRP